MASLFDRLFVSSQEYEKIPCHIFYSALVDFAAGGSTRAEVISVFSLDAQATGHLDLLVAAYQNSANKNQWLQELHSVMMLAEWNLKYTTPAEFAARMGL